MTSLKALYAVIGFFILFSCNSSSPEEQSRTFDIPLLEKNEELRRTSDHIAITKLNKEYLQIAYKNNYQEGKALCYINMANVNLSMGSYKNAQLLLKKAESILSTSDNNIIKTRLYQDYALLSSMLRFYEHGLTYNAKAMYYVKKINPSKVRTFLLARTYYDRGDLLNENKQHDSALIYLHKALQIKDKPLYESAIAKHHMKYTHNMDSASIYIQRTQDLLKNRSKKNAQYTFVYYTIGNYYNTINNYSKAETAYKKVLSVGAETNDSYYFFNQYVYKALANIYKKTGSTEEEHYYLHLYISAKEDIDDRQHEVANLTVKNFILGITQSEDEKEKKYLIYTSIFILCVIAAGFYIYKKIRVLKLRKEILATEKESLKYETELLKIKVHDKNFDEVIDLAKSNDSTFLAKFREVYPNFINKLLEINPDLENSELILCAMLKLNFSSKEIANYLFIQHKPAQQKKSRIRKRLSLPSDADLYLFFGQLN